MKIGIQLFVTPRKAITIESSDYPTTGECMKELEDAVYRLKYSQMKADLVQLFGDD